MKELAKNKLPLYLISLVLLITMALRAGAQDVSIKIHLRGVYESKITLIPLTGDNALMPLVEKTGVKNNETTVIVVPKDRLPGEFVLRFDYKSGVTSTPYPAEKSIVISHQNLELWINPINSGNPDSTYFQKDELENAAFVAFAFESNKRKEKLELLKNFIMNYDDAESKLYKLAVEEYENRRVGFNNWVDEQAKRNSALFVSHTFKFEYMPQIAYKGSETERISSLITHYFDGIDFKDTLLLKTTELKEFMNNYVNMYGAMATSMVLRDSLFSAAGVNAIEKAKKGHPLVYGWMVDYFFNGYEANGIDAGMKILEPYIKDPLCLTKKQLQINKRLQGIKTMVQGTKAPDIVMKDAALQDFNLSSFQTTCPYILVLFWSADCSHCEETVKKLYPWSSQPEIKQKVKVVAISMDENDQEVAKWKEKMKELTGWIHLRGEAGVNSKVANDYYILSTPVMFLIDSQNKTIKGSPATVEELVKAVGK